MTEVVVADAGPLIAFGRIGRLHLFRDVLGTILVPEAVAEECLREPLRPGAAAIRQAFREGLLIRKRARRSHLYEEILSVLGEGEAAAIALAHSQGVPVLMDEKNGRRIARGLGLAVIGTGGVLIRAKRRKLIRVARPVLEDLQKEGYRLSGSLMAEILARCGESRRRRPSGRRRASPA